MLGEEQRLEAALLAEPRQRHRIDAVGGREVGDSELHRISLRPAGARPMNGAQMLAQALPPQRLCAASTAAGSGVAIRPEARRTNGNAVSANSTAITA